MNVCVTFSYEELDQQHDYSGNNMDYEGYQQNGKITFLLCGLSTKWIYLPTTCLENVFSPFKASPKVYNAADKRSALYQRFYKQLQEKTPADCVVLSVSNQSTWVAHL